MIRSWNIYTPKHEYKLLIYMEYTIVYLLIWILAYLKFFDNIEKNN